MKKQYIIPASRVYNIRCRTKLLADSYQLQVSNEDTFDQLVKEQNYGSSKNLWDNEW